MKVPIFVKQDRHELLAADDETTNDKQGRRPKTAKGRNYMSQNHYVTKRKRRPKNNNRKDPSAATMAKLRKLAAADAKASSK
jgi:hypothetical protein